MANTKISGLTTDSAPVRSADYVPTYDASAGATKKVLLNLLGVMPLIAEFTTFSPADGTTYYFGALASLAPSTTGATRRIYIPRAGIITAAYISFVLGGTGTTETSTLSLRLNNTSDTTLNSSMTMNGASFIANTTAISVTVATGDYVECKWVCPTWVTNPTNISGRVLLLLE